MKKKIDIVVPCFNESEVIGTTVEHLVDFADKASGYNFRFIMVDDGSKDDTRSKILEISNSDQRFVPVLLTRNFGHQIAVTAGIDASNADATVIIDADLQDPVNVIFEMIREWESGADVVYGTRLLRKGESRFKILSARAFYRILNGLSDVPIPLDTGDFRLMSRKVVFALKQLPEQQRFVRGLVAWVGGDQRSVTYERAPRFAGVTKYPLSKMIKFASDGILSFSNKPLRLAIHLGFWCATGALIFGVYYLFLALSGAKLVPGWASTIVSVFLLGGIQLFSVGLIGEYIGRIYNEVKNRPLYLVDSSPNKKN